MFTGLISEIGEVKNARPQGGGRRILVSAPITATDCEIGDSIAIDGVCLTVVETRNEVIGFDVSEETTQNTTLKHLRAGEKLNVESALRAGDRFGGHFMQGHVDTTGSITTIRGPEGGREGVLEVELPHSSRMFLVSKGSIAVDGISLTIQSISGNSFMSIIVPHTYRATILQYKRSGSLVNIEFDMIVKTLHGMLPGVIEGVEELTFDKLRKWGY